MDVRREGHGLGQGRRRSAALVATLLAAAVAAGGGLGAASPSNQAVAYQVDPGHSGYQADGGLGLPLRRRWTASFSAPTSYPLVAGGMVYVTAAANTGSTLYALDQADGHVVWAQPVPGTYSFSAAAYDGGRVFVLNFDGVLRAFDAATGAPAWSLQLPGQWAFTSPPTATGGIVYAGGAGSGGTLYSVVEASGAVLATQPVLNGDHSSPAVSGGVFVSYACDQAFGFSLVKLVPLWHHDGPCEGGGGKTAVAANGRVYARDFLGNLILDASTGAELGAFAPAGTAALAPATDGSSLFVLAGSPGTLTAQSAAGGPARWSFTGDGGLDTAPLAVSSPSGEYVLEGSSSGMLYALDAATGTLLWSSDAGAPIAGPDEQNATQLTGLAAGQGLLVVPAGNTVVAYSGDHTPPSISVPATITVRTASPDGKAVSYTVTAADPDDTATVGCAPSSGSVFPVGTTTVSCTASDTNGNTATASFQVVVVLDTTAPTFALPAAITAKATSAGGAAVGFAVAASDPDDAVTVGCTPASGSLFPVGTSTVTCTAADTVGNTTSGSFYVVVSAPGADCVLSHYPTSKGALNLKSANLSGCYLPNASLAGANASSANLAGAYLAGANLAGAKLNFADLTGAKLTGANLTGVSWTQATCPDGTNASSHGSTCLGHLG